ncbi:hypothetical protein [Altericroceibacterium endophyticum]|uniref:Lipoprotein n=1 Tax=Altericroceibacterium endophyticum TaxID=1808508 RepID=A0A6I4T711_9SPHN|nr:hypothetical protein [Altericroceibacterium endophyticum]MXO66269.1 hypothetical protein [Altericroceibacterium endophyticum]
MNLKCLSGLALCLSLAACGSNEKEIPEEPSATAKVDAIEYFQHLSTKLVPCDQAGKNLGSAAQDGDVAFFNAATAMARICLSTHKDIKEIPIPASVGNTVHKQFEDAAEVCSNAYLAKWASADAMVDALNEPDKISHKAEMQNAANDAAQGIAACEAALVLAAMNAGATAEELGLTQPTDKSEG